jgi:hypothetical protein
MKTIYLNVPTKDRKEKDIQYTINKMKDVLTAMFEGEELNFLDNHLPESEYNYMKYYFNESYGPIRNEDLMHAVFGVQKLAGVDIVATLSNTGLYTQECVAVESAARIYGIKILVLNDWDSEIYMPDVHEANVKKRQYKQVSNAGIEEGEINY